MDALSFYRQKFADTGEGTREAIIDRAQRQITSDFERLPSFRLAGVVANDGTTSDIRLLSTRKRGFYSEFLIHPEDTLTSGREIRNLMDSSWIVTEVVDIGDTMLKASMYKSNYLLQWMLTPGVLKETPIRIMGRMGGEGIDDTKYLALPNSEKMILLPTNLDTIVIGREKRLMIDGLVYKVVKRSTSSFDGCIELTLEETLKGQWDSGTVADFYEPVVTPDPPQPTTHMTGSKEIIRSLSEEYRLYVGTTQVTSGIVWSINNPNFTFSTKNGVATVTAPSRIDLVGSSVTITSTYFGTPRSIVAKSVSLV